MRVCIVGLGKIGLPLAALCAAKGLDVVGSDLSQAMVTAINRGVCPLVNEPEVPDMIASAVRDGRLGATTDTTAAAASADVIVIVVPLMTGEDRIPEYGSIDAAVAAVGHGLRPGSLVVIETTVPVGDTRRRFGPLLERTSGLRAGEDFYLAFSPERVQSNRVIRDLRTYPKLVGGIDSASRSRAQQFYERVVDAPVMALSSSEAAEFTKLAESVYRDVNIALANQLALYAQEVGVDMAEVIPAANSEPLSHVHRPGLGVGGHCMPIYPHFMLGQTSELSLVALARSVNDAMPARAAERLADALGGLRGRKVLVLGVAYRANVKEVMLSPALDLVRELEMAGAEVVVNDPLYDNIELRRLGVEPVDLESVAGLRVDAIVINSFHSQYRALDVTHLPGQPVVLDGAAALDASVVEGAGLIYLRMGRPDSARSALVSPV